ncbi:MAG: Sua5/YciO/YrdC/YwlC family protein, partial [Kineosporiaceae bacterium]
MLAEVQGAPAAVDAFCRRVRADAPPLAAVEDVTWTGLPVRPAGGFRISASEVAPGRTLVPADVATCPDCLAELRDPGDRRFRHPFITCTNCGPRFTIVTALPYDRPSTTMAGFPLCPECAAEYADPADRRFHAQPIACHTCGPRLTLEEAPAERDDPAAGEGGDPAAGESGDPAAPVTPITGEAAPVTGEVVPVTGEVVPAALAAGAATVPATGEVALARARRLLARGRIVAVKGLGGYHLACDAGSEEAVARLRRRKRRGGKPFAVLVPDLDTAAAITHVDDAEAALLGSPRAPIVLLRRRTHPPPGAPRVVPGVAPGNPDLGVMLPPTGLHHLLLGLPGDPPGPRVLVLTSGNLSGEPIVTGDAEARRDLAGVADAWLGHDRPIHVPCDDSVLRVVDGVELPLRRSRGYAPLPVILPVDVDPVLAVGGDLKNTFCLASGRYAWLSAHVGDLDQLSTREVFDRATAQLADLVDVRPRVVVADRHPGYRGTAWARHRCSPPARTGRGPGIPPGGGSGRGRPGVPAGGAGESGASPGGGSVAADPPVLRQVQHHHAHIAAVMAEHGLDGNTPVLGLALDGTGYGDDGTVWGGELLVADYDGFTRFAHLDTVPLAGGDASVRRPYRMALAHLRSAGLDWDERLPCVAACPPVERRV